MIGLEPRPATADALQELLRAAAVSSSPQRPAAVRYMHCRTTLLDGELRATMPGFLIQCLSLDKFHQFIHLYHPSPDARLAFLDEALARCGAQLEKRRTYDVFSDPDF